VIDSLAPEVGLEPTTLRLTAECSAIELLRSVLEREDEDSHALRSFSYNKYRYKGQRQRCERGEPAFMMRVGPLKGASTDATYIPTKAR
jgi:hypothetical protein